MRARLLGILQLILRLRQTAAETLLRLRAAAPQALLEHFEGGRGDENETRI